VTATTIVILALLIFAAATLYASVGHAGASGYLAAMALFGLSPEVMKPTALCLNILVASIATFQFARAGYFRWRLFLPFAVASAPLAYVGGVITLPGEYYRPLVGAVLLFAAIRLLLTKPASVEPESRAPLVVWCLVAGGAIGLLSGLTGTGGGIFLSPLVLFLRWGHAKEASAVSAAFILVNSVAGLAGQLARVPQLPSAVPVWAFAAVAGGILGSHYGSKRLPTVSLRRLLGLVLIIAGVKLCIL
jgi:hypothetical protein